MPADPSCAICKQPKSRHFGALNLCPIDSTFQPEPPPADPQDQARRLRRLAAAINNPQWSAVAAEIRAIADELSASSPSEATSDETYKVMLEQLALDHIAIGADNATRHLSLAARQRLERSRDTKFATILAALRSVDRRDSERMDWLEQKADEYSSERFSGFLISINETSTAIGMTGDAVFNGFPDAEGPTLREAIDAAMAPSENVNEQLAPAPEAET